MSARRAGLAPRCARRCKIGNMKAAVLPVPVCADPIRSRPARAYPVPTPPRDAVVARRHARLYLTPFGCLAAVDKSGPPSDVPARDKNQRLFRGPGLPPVVLFVFLAGSRAEEKRPDGSDAGRQRPTGLRPEEVPPPDHPSRTVPGHEAEALLRESERSTSAEGQGSGAPQGEVRSPPRTPLSQEYSRWHASPVS